MHTRNVVLTKRQKRLIEMLIDSGRYQNASEVLRERLRRVEEREVPGEAHLAVRRAAAAEGIAALERGEFREFSDPAALKAHLNGVAVRVLTDR